MNPLSLAYGTAVFLRNLLYDTGFFSAQLNAPVISVGSISAGGAGKTPLVLLLGELLKQRQIPFDVLSRGYGRKSKGVRLVDPAGEAVEFGDEPLLIARRLGVPVIVGENRYHAGLFAEQKFGAQMHLLDDGFQHRALARDFDIVLFTAAESHDRLLPAGRLREPRGSLVRADAVVVLADAAKHLSEAGLSTAVKAQRLWLLRRRAVLPSPLPRKPVVFCGIARPDDFFDELLNAGLSPVSKLAFPDHHAYGEGDIERLLRLRDSGGADGFLTTEKDAINLGRHVAALQPLETAKVELELEDAGRVITDMLLVVSTRHHARS